MLCSMLCANESGSAAPDWWSNVSVEADPRRPVVKSTCTIAELTGPTLFIPLKLEEAKVSVASARSIDDFPPLR